MRISDWSSDVCSSDLGGSRRADQGRDPTLPRPLELCLAEQSVAHPAFQRAAARYAAGGCARRSGVGGLLSYRQAGRAHGAADRRARRSEEHTSELQSLMRISYAVFCLKKKNSPNSYSPFISPNLHTNTYICICHHFTYQYLTHTEN